MIELGKLNETLLRYIDNPNTDYAIMLNGEWGSGKTFYLKNSLKTLIEKERKEIKVYYLSLFGIKDIGDLSTKLLLEVIPIKNERIKVIGKGLLTLFGKDDVAKGTSDKILNVVGSINNKTLLIFDDLERVAPDVIIEIVGYINQFVEHEGAKVIIAANEKEIRELNEEKTVLKVYLEKIIRYTINFIVPFEETSSQIYSAYSINEETQRYIKRAFKKGLNQNLRTLQFICSICNDIIKSIPDEPTTKPHHDRLKELSIYFISFIAIEIKNGSLKIEEARKISTFTLTTPLSSLFNDFSNVEVKDVSKNKKRITKKVNDQIDSIKEKYFDSEQIMYFESLVELLYSGFLNKEKFQEEINTYIIHANREFETEEGIVWKSLSNVLLLEDEELNQYVEKALQFAEEGKYTLETYYNIFNLIRNLKNRKLLKIKDKSLYDRLYKGLSKSTLTGFHLDLLSAPESSDKYLFKIYQEIIKRYKHLKNAEKMSDADDHLKMIFQTPLKYLEEYCYNNNESIPTFGQSISVKDFIMKFEKCSNVDKNYIIQIFASRTANNVR